MFSRVCSISSTTNQCSSCSATRSSSRTFVRNYLKTTLKICSSAGLVWVLAYLPSLPSNSAPLIIVLLLELALRLASLAFIQIGSEMKPQQGSETIGLSGRASKDVVTECGWYNVDEEKYEQAWGSGISMVI